MQHTTIAAPDTAPTTPVPDPHEAFLHWEASTRDAIDVKRAYIKIADGDHVAGVLLAQMIFWNLPSNGGEIDRLRVEKEGKFWLRKKRTDWSKECEINPKQFDRASKRLINRGILTKKLFRYLGSPTLHWRLNVEALMAAVEAVESPGPCNVSPEELRISPKGKMEFPLSGNSLRPKIGSHREKSKPLPLPSLPLFEIETEKPRTGFQLDEGKKTEKTDMSPQLPIDEQTLVCTIENECAASDLGTIGDKCAATPSPAPASVPPPSLLPAPAGRHSPGHGPSHLSIATRHYALDTLQDNAALSDVCHQGVKEGHWSNTKRDRLKVFTLAQHALRTAKDPQNPGPLFAENIRHQRWYGTDQDEAVAEARLLAYERLRAQPPITASDPPPLSRDAWCVRELQRELARDGVHVDVLAQLQREDAARWPDEHCQSIARELAHYQRDCQQATALHRLGESDPEDGPDDGACADRDMEDVDDGELPHP